MMSALSSVRRLLDSFFRRSRAEREIEEELRSHLRSRADDLERQGLPRAEAERQARIEFGGYQRYKEECREALGTRLLRELIADVRYGLRQLRRNPGFTAVAIITLALGIAASASIFAFVVATAKLMRGLLFGTQAWDAPTLAAVVAILAISTMLASFIPARRATRVDPMVALRHE